MTEQKAKIHLGSLELNLAEGMIMAFETFGRDVLKRNFKFSYEGFPINPKAHLTTSGTINVDSYNTAAHILFEKAYAKGESLFLGSTTDYGLIAPEMNIMPFASSWQLRDLKSGEIISPNYGSVIISSRLIKGQGEKGKIKAGILGLHELGHLVFGTGADVCHETNCVYSHPKNHTEALENNALIVLRGGQIPVCERDKQRIKEFQQKWGIK